MKKYLLSLLIAGITFIGFSSAENYYGMSYTCSVGGQIEGYNQCDDDYLIFDNFIEGDYVLNVSSSLDYFDAKISVVNGSFDEPGVGITMINPYEFPGNHNLYCNEGGCQQLNIYAYGNFVGNTPALISFSLKLIGGEEGGDGGQLVPGGIADFTPVITGLTNSINEFIPYVVYIGLGVLGVIVGFFAIKRLLRYVNRSTFSVFKSRRKK